MQVTKTLTVVNQSGLHIRAARSLVETANRFKSDVWIENEGLRVNGKSIMGILQLQACHDSHLVVVCEGEDAELMLAAIEALVKDGFGIDETL